MAERVMPEAELWVGEMSGVVVQGERLVLVRLDDGVCAFRDRCPHQGHPLSEGKLEAGVLTCRFHQHTFDAASGAGINPRQAQLTRLPAHLAEGQIWVELPEPSRVEP